MRDRLASEIEEERAARLQWMSANQRHRFASETEEERAARLQQMSANQCHSLAAETGSEREANVDMQYCLSRHRVVEYCTKYATKCEPHSQPLKEVFTNIVRRLKDDNTSLKAVQKLLINSVGERDYSAQETCYLLLQLPTLEHPETSSCSASMDLVQWKITWMKTSLQLVCQHLTTTLVIPPPLSSMR